MSELFADIELARVRKEEYERGWLDGRADLKASARPEVAQLLQAQEHAIACGNLALELQSALAMLKNACDEAGWPKTAEQMAPMNMARAVLKKKLETTPSPLARNSYRGMGPVTIGESPEHRRNVSMMEQIRAIEALKTSPDLLAALQKIIEHG